MRKLYLLLAICVTTTSAAIPRQERIIGGSIVDISRFPSAAVVLVARDNVFFRHECGSAILNNLAVLSAAHCWVVPTTIGQVRIRVGSTNASSGGALHNVAQLIAHPNFNVGGMMDNDIGVIRLASAIVFGSNVQVGWIAGPAYNLQDNEPVWAIGWGFTEFGGTSEQLRQAQLRTVNQAACRSIYGSIVTDNKLCAGWNVDGRGVCSGDSGGPLLHGNVIVGVVSMSGPCGQARFPGIFARVSIFSNWIRAVAEQ